MTSESRHERPGPWGVAGLYALVGLACLGLGLYDGPRFWEGAASDLGEVACGVAMLAAAAVSVRRRESTLYGGLPAVIALAGVVALFVGLQVDGAAQGHPVFDRGFIVLLAGSLFGQLLPSIVRWWTRRSVR